MNYTIKGLEKLCVNWEIKNSDDKNTIQLNFQDIAKTNKIRNDKNNIINLRDYHNK